MIEVVRAAALQGYAALVRSLGSDPEPLLRRYGLSAQEVTDAERFVSLEAVAMLLEDSAKETACPDFGLRLSAEQKPELLGALAIVLMDSSTVHQAITDVSRYLFLHSPAYDLTLDRPSPLFSDCESLRFEIRLAGAQPLRQLIDGCLGDTWRWIRLLTAGAWQLKAVSLPHTPLATPEVYRRFFEAPVYFGQPYAGLHAPLDAWTAEIPQPSPLVRQATLDLMNATVGPRPSRIADRVAHVLVATMGTTIGTQDAIAQLLGMHSRTLQRRLAAEATTFGTIRDEVYQRSALRLLRETDLPIAQVAGALGYSDNAAFTRACRRWFADTPSRMRRATHS